MSGYTMQMTIRTISQQLLTYSNNCHIIYNNDINLYLGEIVMWRHHGDYARGASGTEGGAALVLLLEPLPWPPR
jgi:hypothetical protein